MNVRTRSAAPESLADLRRFVEHQRTASGRECMGDRMLTVLVDLLDNPGQAAVQSISELAVRNGVDPSTLTRLGKRLGFSGFAPLQALFRGHVAATQPFYSSRVEELVASASKARSGGTLEKLAEAECQKVLAAASKLSEKQIARAVKRLVTAKHVYVLGLRATYAVAYFFGSFLGNLRDRVTVLGAPGFPLAGELANIKKDDLLVALTFRPYTRTVVAAVGVARSEGIPVLSITDGGSPVNVAPNEGVTLEVEQPFYLDSSLAQFFVAEALLLGVARHLGPRASAVIRRREMINRTLNIEVT